jgi:radical SAM peptide maturase (CXXX-repeat target family)
MKNDKRKKFENFTDYIARLYPDIVANNPKPGSSAYIKEKKLARTFTFQVTDKCNLACTYCYQINKSTRRMSFETAKKAVDSLLTGDKGFDKYICPENSPAIVLEFIGGEPFLEIDLIDQIVDYFRLKALELNHPWAEKFIISICSNGVLYRDPKVQAFLQKNKDVLSFSVTVDGIKELHDACRVFPDGSPSYDLAHDAAIDWMNRGYYMGSKITISPDNITYLSKCLKQMILDGYYDINANCVYEKGWEPHHATELYRQCKDFIDWFVENENPQEYSISLLNDDFGQPKGEDELNNWCGGVGFMLAVDPDGKYFPCIRYMESSLGNSRPPLTIGDVDAGLMSRDCEKSCVECMNSVTRRSQSTDECFYCPVASGCSWCSAYNYQETGSFDKRITYICEMHKARCLAVTYYSGKLYEKYGEDFPLTHTGLWVPEQWAVPIVGQEEYDYLVKKTLEHNGYVNKRAKMVKFATKPPAKPNEIVQVMEVLK